VRDFLKERAAEESRAKKEQAIASDPLHSVWVEASAGTGKTKVLSDRVLRLLMEGVVPSKILCLTFTKAAAVEMSTRVYDRLSKWTIMSDKDLYEELQKLYNQADILQKRPELEDRARKLFALVLDAPQPIKIQTIHSFCTEILKRFPLEAGVSPYFEVMDDQTSNEILDQISAHFLNIFSQTQDKDIRKAVLFLTSHIKEMKWGDFLRGLIEKRHLFLKIFRSFENIEIFQKELAYKFGLSSVVSEEQILKEFEEKLPREKIRKCANALALGSKVDKEHAAFLYQALESFDYEVYTKAFLKKDGTEFSELAHKEAINQYENILADMDLELVRIMDTEEKLKSFRVYKATISVAAIALKLFEEYNHYKKEYSKLDYDDLIVLTRELLEKEGVSSWVLYKLDGGIDHVLIDEAQDTSPAQWFIVKALTGEFFSGFSQSNQKRTVFAVGDRKQSIFGFQGADPEKFEQMKDFYHTLISKEDFSEINLAVSFRSTRAVLEMVNKLFSINEAKEGVVGKGQEVKHLPYRLGEAGLIELWNLDEEEQKEDDFWELPLELKEEETSVAKLSLRIAQKIKDMVSKKEILASKGRPVCYRDFMVLVRKREPFMEEFVKACKKIGVSITGLDRLALLNEIVVEDLISLSRFLLLPDDDLSLAEVLKSPLYELDDDDLFELCYERKDKSLWQRLCSVEKYAPIKEELSSLLIKADYVRPFELFYEVLSVFEGRKRFYKRLGLEAKDALDEFMNLALSFEIEHVPNLQNFVVWLEASEVEIKRELEQPTSDAVRLMTVHTSKGLQAPIVILPDTMRLAQNKREKSLIFDEDLFYFPLCAKDYNQACEKAYKLKHQKEIEESRRLLYVALTRAEDRLYIAGFGKALKEKEDREKNWYELCKEALEGMPVQKKKEKLVLETPQEIEVKKEDIQKAEVPSSRSDAFAFQKAKREKALSKPYSPSHMDENDDTPVSSPLEDDGFCFRRGTIIHKLLQMLPSHSNFENKEKLIKAYLAKQNDLNDRFKKDIETEVLNVLKNKDFAFIFEGNSRAEVPVMGEVDGHIVSGQIDRLLIEDERVVVVDFKTNRPAAKNRDEVLGVYIKQLEIYQKLLEKIYKGKKVETYILWTNTLKLMKI